MFDEYVFEEYEKIVNCKMLVFDIIHNRHKAEELGCCNVDALFEAAVAIEEQHGNKQSANILNYLANAGRKVYVFRDEYTMRALRDGLMSLQRKEEELRRRCKETNLS